MEPLTCPRHPSAETYLRCSSCETPICLDCSHEAAVGYQCPDCAGAREEAAAGASRRATPSRRGLQAPTPTRAEGRLPVSTAVKALGAGVGAAIVGGLVLGPVFTQGFFFLITAGVVGWGVAHGVFFGTGGITSPFVRAAALASGALAVAIGMATVPLWDPGAQGIRELAFLSYPAALYGAWITVRSRV